MANWLDENATLLYMLFGMATLVLAVLWWRTRHWRYLVGAGVPVILIGIIFLLGRLMESDAQQIERKIKDMAEGVKARDLNRVFAHISDQFQYHSYRKRDFRPKVEAAIASHNPENVLVWDFVAKDVSRQNRTAKVEFMVKAKGNWPGSELGYRCEAEFVLDPDDQWRLKGFEIFEPYVHTHEPIQIPGL